MAKSNGSIIGFANGYSTLGTYNSSTTYYIVGYNNSNRYAGVLKFKTPSFSGVSTSITFNFYAQIRSTESNLRYAICSSDSNATKYMGTTSAVSDTNQILSGTISLTSVSSTEISKKTINVSTDKLKSNTTYYLFLWCSNNTNIQVYDVMSSTRGASVSLVYEGGIIYIDNGESFDSYQVYIDNGTSWDMYIPYIDNGSGWDICN